MKKLSFLLSLCLLALLAFPLCALGQESDPAYDIAYDSVAEAGFPMKNMDPETVLAIYDEIKDAESVTTDTTTTTLDIAIPGQIAPLSYIPSSDLSFSVTTGKVVSGGKVTSVTVYVYYEWDEYRPWVCLEDAISVNWDEDFIFKDHSFTAKRYSFAGALKESLDRPALLSQQGLGWFIDLISPAAGTYGNGHFSLIPRGPMDDGTTYTSSVTAVYGHKRIIDLSASGLGVQITHEDDYCSASSSFCHDMQIFELNPFEKIIMRYSFALAKDTFTHD